MNPATDFVATLFKPEDLVELRLIMPGRGFTLQRWTRATEFYQQLDWLTRKNEDGYGIYCGAAPRSRDGTGNKNRECTPKKPCGNCAKKHCCGCTAEKPCGGCNECVHMARFFFADLDNIDWCGAQSRLKDSGLPSPTMAVLTGGGVHYWWGLDAPLTDLERWKRIELRIIDLLDADGIKDCSRIMRVPNFVNTKAERNGTVAELKALEPDRLYSVDEFDEEPAAPAQTEVSISRATLEGGDEINRDDSRTAVGSLKVLAPKRCDDYHDWIAVGMALHATDSSEAMLCEWDEWSRQSEKYEPEVCREKWASFDAHHGCNNDGKGPITIATLIQMAGEDCPGWRNGTIKQPPQWRPFPTNVLPHPLAAFVEEGAAAMDVDPSYVALPALTAMAAAIGTTRTIRLKPDWREPSILWAAIVGKSGTRKSPPIDLSRDIVQRKQSEAFREHEEDEKIYQEDLDAYESDLRSWKSGGKQRGQPRPEKPKEPHATRYLISDATIEAVADRLQHNPRSVWLCRDELAGWVRSFDCYRSGGKGGDAQKWIETHGGRPMTIDRKTGDSKTIHIPMAAVSICGGIQPAILQDSLGKQHFESGLAARLLLAFPPPRINKWTDASMSDSVRAAFTRILDKLHELKHDTWDNGDPKPVDIPLTDSGQAAFVEFYDEWATRKAEAPTEAIAASLSKLEGVAARLALVFHFVRSEAGDPTLEDPDAVDAKSIEAGAALAKWFAHEAERVYAAFAETDEERDQRKLIELIEKRGGAITPNELYHASRRFRSADEAKSALQSLIEAGFGEWGDRPTGPKGGRPTEEFRLTLEHASPKPIGESAIGAPQGV